MSGKMINKHCNKCGELLIINKNWTIYRMNHYKYICNDCKNEYDRENYYTNGGHSAKDNKECTHYLGDIAEQVLSKVFKDVTCMTFNNPGYDFICSHGSKIDVKSGCRIIRANRSDTWSFDIRHNTIADYFLLLAFDNRTNLNPEHIWLIPGKDINNKSGISISETTLKKWDNYTLNKLDDITQCCNIMKGDVC